ncbi:nucleotide kinase [Halobacteriales archaeon QS_8_69_26]|nr:MAG: nucleotide kinase [Halobacteriales archaeon QS_8_69_26]
MPNNYLVTGPPRSGKTTVLCRVVDRCDADGYRVGGTVCPELRSGGDRVGFAVEDVTTGDRRVMAHVDRTAGLSVGKYRVDTTALDALCRTAFSRSLADADLAVVDEIAPMQVHSDEFVRGVRRILDGDRPVVAALHHTSTAGFIGEVRDRGDAELFEVTGATRDDLPGTLADRIRAVA